MKDVGFLSVVFAVMLIAGCVLDSRTYGNGNITSVERTAADFTGIILEGAGNINIHFAENYRVIITTDSNIQDVVTILAKNNLLYIDEKGLMALNQQNW